MRGDGVVKPKKARPLKVMLLVYFMATMLVFCCIIGLLAVFATQSVVRANTIAHYSATTQYVGKNISRELEDIQDICNYMFVNSDVKTLIENAEAKNYAYVRAVDNLDRMLMQNVMSNVYSNLTAMIIFDQNGIVYRFVGDSWLGRNVDHGALIDSEEYRTAADTSRMVISTRDFFTGVYGEESTSISVVHCVMDGHYDHVIGGMLLLFDMELVDLPILEQGEEERFSSYLLNEEGIVLNKADYPLPDGVLQLLPGFQSTEEAVLYRTLEDFDVFLYPIPRQRCYMVFLIAPKGILSENGRLLAVVIAALASGVLLSLILWHSMNRRVVRPIVQIRASLDKARDGRHLPIVTEHGGEIEEIEKLVSSYNRNVRYIDELAGRLIEEKTRYKDLEYKALQSQINSHFITNTLNAIRWLAIIQKATNIKEIIDAFSRLLKSTWQGMEHDTTIEKELSNVQDYLFIQQITHSYNCEIFYDVAPDLMNAPCAKFILQPLVENAYFHGIAPKGGVGTICISCQPEANHRIRIQVTDDGVGMDQETQASVLHSPENGNRFNGIGISNIHQRLRLKYGEEYGISIESEPGSYTRMTVVIPFLDNKEEEEERDV